jgi:hypothetical protein
MKNTNVSKNLKNKHNFALPFYILFVLITQNKKGMRISELWSRILKYYYIFKKRS